MKSFDKNTKALLAILAAGFLGGTLTPFIKIVLKEIPPVSFTFLRFTIASIIILPFLIKELSKTRGNHLKAILLSLFGTGNVAFFALGVRFTTATISNTLFVASPIIVALLSYIILNERLIKKKIIGIIIGFMGAVILILLPALGEPSKFKGDLQGNLIVAIAVISFSFYQVFSKQLQRHYSPLSLTGFFMLATPIVLFPFAFLELSTSGAWWTSISVSTMALTLFIGSIGTVGFYFIYQYAIKGSTATTASMALYLQPVFAFLWASALLGERLTLGFVIGAAFAFTGAYVVTKRSHSKLELPAE